MFCPFKAVHAWPGHNFLAPEVSRLLAQEVCRRDGQSIKGGSWVGFLEGAGMTANRWRLQKTVQQETTIHLSKRPLLLHLYISYVRIYSVANDYRFNLLWSIRLIQSIIVSKIDQVKAFKWPILKQNPLRNGWDMNWSITEIKPKTAMPNVSSPFNGISAIYKGISLCIVLFWRVGRLEIYIID